MSRDGGTVNCVTDHLFCVQTIYSPTYRDLLGFSPIPSPALILGNIVTTPLDPEEGRGRERLPVATPVRSKLSVFLTSIGNVPSRYRHVGR